MSLSSSSNILLATYYGRLESNVEFVSELPIAGLHIDLSREAAQLSNVVAAVKETKINLSLGVISGRNIWKNDFSSSIELVKQRSMPWEVIGSLSRHRHTLCTLLSLSRQKKSSTHFTRTFSHCFGEGRGSLGDC